MVLTEILNKIGYITLNRPEKRNALGPDLIRALDEAFQQFESDDQVKVIVLRANGKAFCAGADLAYLQDLQGFSYEENLEDSLRLKQLFARIYALPKVVIAEVQGHAIAGGCGLMSVCDFAFTVPEALFGYTEVRIGFIPALVSVFLQEQIGGAKTQELLLSGELVSAEKAKELGLVNEIVSPEELTDRVAEFAGNLIQNNSSNSMAQTKTLLRKLDEENREKNLLLAAEMNARGRAHHDCVHGISSFLNKQKPQW
ncbi:enoyl-CoA hydratase/isomerase family protein [Algoriphagus namhaensis]|uniref:Enoyl-CoA hydratase/isomerase family protein n=1 Tax=Algoriphagus namhaensis TaxID=915353 RepID=A0ABV8ATS7_9BACT